LAAFLAYTRAQIPRAHRIAPLICTFLFFLVVVVAAAAVILNCDLVGKYFVQLLEQGVLDYELVKKKPRQESLEMPLKLPSILIAIADYKGLKESPEKELLISELVHRLILDFLDRREISEFPETVAELRAILDSCPPIDPKPTLTKGNR